MSSLRGQESVRKAIAAGYGNPPGMGATDSPEDGTYQLCRAGFDVALGDWVCTEDAADGHPVVTNPSSGDEAKWIGVVQHKAAMGEWVRVKTAGTTAAKVDNGPTAGDMLEVYSGTSARKLTGTAACGRFLYRFQGTTELGMVRIGGDVGGSQIVVHHHDTSKNTKVLDRTSATVLTAPLWNILKVTNIIFTGTPDPRLMFALGGGSSHGESPKEGFGWAGVIGANGSMGFGEVGGNEASGNIGVLGAEASLSSSSDSTGMRINVRSWAGVNARDRYGLSAPVVAPIRYSWCPSGGNSGASKKPTWWVPSGCDCILGTTTSDLCDPSIEWWSGTMKLDPIIRPQPFTHTPWQQQWTPQLALERDCCETEYKKADVPNFLCGIISNPERLERNAEDVSGAYEDLIPWRYREKPGRLSVLHAICCHALHIEYIWKFMLAFGHTVDSMFKCIDAKMIAHSWGGCCGTITPASVPAVVCGPTVKKCVDIPEPTPTDPPVTTPEDTPLKTTTPNQPNTPGNPTPQPPAPPKPGGSGPPVVDQYGFPYVGGYQPYH